MCLWVVNNLCCLINFMFVGCFDVVFGNSALGISLADLTYGFNYCWFCADIKVLWISWRVFFTMTDNMGNSKNVNNYFTVLRPLKKVDIWIWWHYANIGDKVCKLSCKNVMFSIFRIIGIWSTKQKFQKLSYTSSKYSLIVWTCVPRAYHILKYLIWLYVKNHHNNIFMNFCTQNDNTTKNYISDLTNLHPLTLPNFTKIWYSTVCAQHALEYIFVWYIFCYFSL